MLWWEVVVQWEESKEKDIRWVDFEGDRVLCRDKWSHCHSARGDLLNSLILLSLEKFQNRG